jgi:hypothetical protein
MRGRGSPELLYPEKRERWVRRFDLIGLVLICLVLTFTSKHSSLKLHQRPCKTPTSPSWLWSDPVILSARSISR